MPSLGIREQPKNVIFPSYLIQTKFLSAYFRPRNLYGSITRMTAVPWRLPITMPVANQSACFLQKADKEDHLLPYFTISITATTTATIIVITDILQQTRHKFFIKKI